MSVGCRGEHRLSMLITMDRTGGYEDVLRSLGAVLDERGARTVIVRDIAAGLMVRALVPTGVDDEAGELLTPIELTLTSPTLLDAQVEALLRRGTAHAAGPIEEALRAVGREIDVRATSGATDAPDGEPSRWSMWHHRITDGQVEIICLTTEELEGFGLTGS